MDRALTRRRKIGREGKGRDGKERIGTRRRKIGTGRVGTGRNGWDNTNDCCRQQVQSVMSGPEVRDDRLPLQVHPQGLIIRGRKYETLHLILYPWKLWERDLWEGEEYPSSRTFENGSKSKSDLFRAAASKIKIAMMIANLRDGT
jgi:hypothetical protein